MDLEPLNFAAREYKMADRAMLRCSSCKQYKWYTREEERNGKEEEEEEEVRVER